MLDLLHNTDPDFSGKLNSRLSARTEESRVDEAVRAILDDVRKNGDEAVIALTRKFDRLEVTPQTLRIPAERIRQQAALCPTEAREALKVAARRIRAFHEKQKPKDIFGQDRDGVFAGLRWTAMERAGIYVPGGTAAYPSSVLMNALPARVAGVNKIVMTSPAPDGKMNPAVLAAAEEAGVDEIYTVGGAQAIAALAYGTESIPRVDMIAGPGNAYVAAAKRMVFGTVSIDSVAGPSEITVVADGTNRPDWIAMDLLSQAEHDPEAQAILITDDESFAHSVARTALHFLNTLPRREVAEKSLENHSCIIVLDSLQAAPDIVNTIAPEHLELAVENPKKMLAKIHNAGAIFLGAHTPEAVGDYTGGPNHVLPTGGTARFSSGLGVIDFMKRTSMLACDEKSLHLIGGAAAALAEAEGLDAHAMAVRLRMENTP